MLKLQMLAIAKASLLGTVIISAISTIDSLGIPASWQVLFDGIVIGWSMHSWGSSYTTGLVEPSVVSTDGYIHWFRSCHAVFNKGTAYFAHKSVWRMITAERDYRKGERGVQESEQ